MPPLPGTPADPDRSGPSSRNASSGVPGSGRSGFGRRPPEDKLVAGRGLTAKGAPGGSAGETSGATADGPSKARPGASSNDWFTRPSREEIQAHPPPRAPRASRIPRAPHTAGPAAPVVPPGPSEEPGAAAPVERPAPARPSATSPLLGGHERGEGLVRVELAGSTEAPSDPYGFGPSDAPDPSAPPESSAPHGRSGRGGRRRRSAPDGRSRRRPVLTTAAVVAASALAVGTGVALDRIVLPGLRSDPASGPRAGQAAPPTPGPDFDTRRPAGAAPPPGPAAGETPPPLKVLPHGTLGPSPDPDPSSSASPEATSPGTGTASGGSSGKESTVVMLTNRERTKHGCAPLRVDSRLATAARRHSADMARYDYFSHNSRNGATPWDRMKAAGYTDPGAENIAKGYATPAAVVDGWMKSPGHRANILNCKLRAIGVGMAAGSGGPWWTQDFGWT